MLRSRKGHFSPTPEPAGPVAELGVSPVSAAEAGEAVSWGVVFKLAWAKLGSSAGKLGRHVARRSPGAVCRPDVRNP